MLLVELAALRLADDGKGHNGLGKEEEAVIREEHNANFGVGLACPVPGGVYHSTQVRGDTTMVGIGPGLIGEHRYQARSSGNVYDTRNPPPGRCFNCGELHWRINCPYTRYPWHRRSLVL